MLKKFGVAIHLLLGCVYRLEQALKYYTDIKNLLNANTVVKNN